MKHPGVGVDFRRDLKEDLHRAAVVDKENSARKLATDNDRLPSVDRLSVLPHGKIKYFLQIPGTLSCNMIQITIDWYSIILY